MRQDYTCVQYFPVVHECKHIYTEHYSGTSLKGLSELRTQYKKPPY